jgi:hypothetical protein
MQLGMHLGEWEGNFSDQEILGRSLKSSEEPSSTRALVRAYGQVTY